MHTPTGSHPLIVFVHGILGFSSLHLLGAKIRYFRNLRERLEELGIDAHFPALPPSGTITERAKALATYLEKTGSRHVHLIAHSMGGLDCRYLIHHLDPEHRVKSLCTVATPHRGTPLAEWLTQEPGLISSIARRIAIPGLADLTPTACEAFNQEVKDRADVCYRSYAGVRPAVELSPLLRPWGRRLQQAAGDNDGQVPLQSAQWGEFIASLRADHFELVGWSLGLPDKKLQRPFDHVDFFAAILKELTTAT